MDRARRRIQSSGTVVELFQGYVADLHASLPPSFDLSSIFLFQWNCSILLLSSTLSCVNKHSSIVGFIEIFFCDNIIAERFGERYASR